MNESFDCFRFVSPNSSYSAVILSSLVSETTHSFRGGECVTKCEKVRLLPMQTLVYIQSNRGRRRQSLNNVNADF